VTVFQYHAAIIEQFPEVVGGAIVAQGMRSGPSSEKLQAAFLAEQQAVLARIGATPLSELPSLAAWRRAFTSFGVKPTQYRSAAEALLRRLTKKGDIPAINTLVDIGNLVSIRYGLPVAVFDRRAAQGVVTVHFADGSETFTELDSAETVHPEPGEVIFSDEQKIVIARRWCWRQSAESAARDDTTDAVITFEAQHEGGRQAVEQAGDELLALLREYAGGEYELAILSASRPAV
jgi:DNA/RNA-binding domain of Phe-tRNA-synthetase-like protein